MACSRGAPIGGRGQMHWVMRGWRVGVLVLGASLAGCGANGAASAQARVTVVHVDPRGGAPSEGALTDVVVSDAQGKVVFQKLVQYPAPPAAGKSRRYDLLRGVELPTGRLTLRFEVRPCTGSCPDPATADASDLPRNDVRDVCEIEFEVSAGDARELVVTTPSATADCRMTE